MKNNIVYKKNTASEEELYQHLIKCNNDFVPPLSGTVDIKKYSRKIFDKAIRFEAWSDNILVGCLAGYFNDKTNHLAFITNVSVIKEYWGQGIASKLLMTCIEYTRDNQFDQISLEVNRQNSSAFHLYEKFNFTHRNTKDDTIIMINVINNQNEPQKKL